MADFAEDAYDDAYVPTNEDDDDLTYDTGDDMTLGYSASTPSKKTSSTSKTNSSNKRITRSASKKKEQELALASSSPALSTKIVKEEMNKTVVVLPHQVFDWEDSEMNDRLTILIWCPSGLDAKDIHAKVCKGGRKFQLDFPYTPLLFSPAYYMAVFPNRYNRSHTKIMSFMKKSKMLQALSSARSEIMGTFSIPLPFEVEEQPTRAEGFEGILPIHIKKTGQLFLNIELMGKRTNYSSQKMFQKFLEIDIDGSLDHSLYFTESEADFRNRKRTATTRKIEENDLDI